MLEIISLQALHDLIPSYFSNLISYPLPYGLSTLATLVLLLLFGHAKLTPSIWNILYSGKLVRALLKYSSHQRGLL